jgi:hypothetical protein
MKNVVFWDIKPKLLPHRKHVSATDPSRFEVFAAVTMKKAVF